VQAMPWRDFCNEFKCKGMHSMQRNLFEWELHKKQSI